LAAGADRQPWADGFESRWDAISKCDLTSQFIQKHHKKACKYRSKAVHPSSPIYQLKSRLMGCKTSRLATAGKRRNPADWQIPEWPLKRNIYYHLFPHSSATDYAAKLNRQELCHRYGWKFSSPMRDICISRAGMESKALDEMFTRTELGTVKSELVQMEQAGRIKDERLRQMEDSMRSRQDQVATLGEILSHHPSEAQLKDAIIKSARQKLTG